MSQEKICGAAIIVAGITHDFRDWTVSVIEITGKTGIAGQVWLLDSIARNRAAQIDMPFQAREGSVFPRAASAS